MFSVTRDGREVSPRDYTWVEKTKTFSSSLNRLVLDFSDYNGVTFKTGSYCTFDTGHGCTFKTGFGCTFDTSHGCTFKTGDNCTFKTGSYCTFDTGHGCTFKTGFGCTFDTGFDCAFDTGFDCTFDVTHICTFKTGENCVIIRRDVFEVICPETNKTIKLNGYNIKGFAYIDKHVIIVDGKEIELSEESYNNLKQQLK